MMCLPGRVLRQALIASGQHARLVVPVSYDGNERETRFRKDLRMIARLMSSVGVVVLLSLVSAPVSTHCDTMDGR